MTDLCEICENCINGKCEYNLRKDREVECCGAFELCEEKLKEKHEGEK